MSFRDDLKKYRESQSSKTDEKSTAYYPTSSGASAKSTSGSSGSGGSFRDALRKYREEQGTVSIDGWIKTSVNLINDVRNNSSNWYDDIEYQSRSDRFTTLLSQADNWRKQYAGNNEATSYIDSVVSALSEAKTYSFNSRKYYSQWETKKDYDDYVAYQKDYDAKKNFDITAGEKEIAVLENILEEYKSLTRWTTDEKGARRAAEIRNQYGGEADIKALISQKKQYLNQSRHIQDGIALSSVSGNADFKQYSDYVSTYDDSGFAKLLGKEYDTTYEYVNNRNGFRDEYKSKHRVYSSDNPWSDGESTYEEKGYDYLNENEIAIYNYYYAKDGKEAAEKYLDSIQETLNQRKATAMYKNMEGKTALELAFGVAAGLDQWESGTKNLFNTEDDYIAQTATQIASSMVREDLADDSIPMWYNVKTGKWEDKVFGASLGQVGYDAITTTANMAPSMLTSMAANMIAPGSGAVIGNAMMFASSAGGAYQEALNLGYGKDQARAYSTLVGASEAGLQYLLGGISSLGGKVTNTALTKMLDGIDNALARTALKIGGSMLSEGFEEGLQEVLTPLFKNWTLMAGEDINWSEVAYSGLLGALTAGFMEGPSTIAGEVSTYQTGKQLKAADISAQRLAEIGKTFSADTMAYQLAGKVNENTGAYTMGRLFNEIGATMTEQNISDITNALVEKGMTREVARANAEAMAAVVEGGNLTDLQVAIIESNEVLAEAVRTTIIDSNATWFQRTNGYKDALMAPAQEKSSPKASKTNPAQQSEENAPSADNVDTQNENGSESHYEVSVDGKTIDGDGNIVTIKGISSIEKGRMVLETETGTVDAKDVSYASQGEAMVYEAVAKLEDIIDTETANKLSKHLLKLGGATSNVYINAIEQAYTYGYYGYGRKAMTGENTLSATLTEKQRNVAYGLGEQYRNTKTAADQEAISKKETTTKKVSGKVHFDGDRSTLTERQSASLTAMEKIAEILGVQIHVFESEVNERGQRIGANGWYDPKDSSIHIDLHAGATGEGTMLFTMAHELTHHIRKWSPEKFKVLSDFLMQEYGKKGVNVDGLVRAQIAKAKNSKTHSRDLTYDEAFEEVVADSMELMLSDGNVMKRLEKLKAQDKDLWYQIKKFIDDIATKIRNVYKGLKPDSVEGRYVADMGKAVYKLQELFAEALVDASENYQSSLTPGQEGTIVNQNGDPVAHATDDGTILLSIRTYDEEGRKAFRDYLNKCVKNKKLTKAEMQEMLDGIEEIYGICKDFKDKYAPFSSWSDAAVVRDTRGKPVFSVVTPNGDYKMNLDFSLVCKKRRTLDAVFNEMSRRGIIDDFELGQKSVVKINEIIRKYDLETACALCFVDAKRFRQASMADQFTRLYNELVESLVPEDQRGSIDHFNFSGYSNIKKVEGGIDTWANSKLDFSHINHVLKTYGDGTVEYKAAQYIKTHAEGRKLLLRGDFMSSQGFDAVKTQNQDILKLYNSKKGTGGPKAAFGDVQYLNEIIQKARWWTPEKAYEVGGVRIQSFSDYVPRMVFDYVQMIYDLAATKLPAHAYTKEALFVKQFGLTGVKINMSLIPAIAEGGIAPGLDANGNYVWAGESFDFETAKEIQNAPGYTENCGTICVGVSYKHIVKLLGDPNIRMVIPYHKSGLNPIVAHMNKIAEFTDYTSLKTNPGGCQSTIDKNGSKVEVDFNFNDVLRKTGDPKATIRQYLDWCAKNEYTPRFAEFAWHENYYKLIEDFTLFDKDGKYVPQREVRAVFPKKTDAFGSMKDLIKEGLEEDAIVEGKRDKALNKIVDEIQKTLPKTEAEISDEEQVEQADRDLEEIKRSDRDPLTPEQQKHFDYNQKQSTVGSTLKTLKGSAIKRSTKYGVGKEIGGEIYFHKDYAEDIMPSEVLSQAEHLLEENHPGFEYNCLKYNPKTGVVAFQEAPDFDSAREPVVGDYVSVNTNTGVVKTGHSNYIWHHKWNWVKNDYSGFDVEESWNWSKQWLSTLTEVSDGNGIDRWNTQLDKFGLLKDGEEAVHYSERVKPVEQTFTSADTSLPKQLPALFKDKNAVFVPGGTNVDIGAGKTPRSEEYLAEMGITYYPFDPYNRSKESNSRTLNWLMEGNRADTVTCANVLNVIDTKEARSNVILEAAKALKPDGTAYFTTYEGSTDKKGKKAGDGVARQTGKDTFQNYRKTEEYKVEIREWFGNVERKGALIIAKDPKPNLPKATWEVTPGEGILYSDRDYLDAVNRGDMETAQKMVDEAAKKAGFPVRAYHGSDQFGFTKFIPRKSDDGISLFFSSTTAVAKSYTASNEVRHVGKPWRDNGYTRAEADRVIEEITAGDMYFDGDVYMSGGKYIIEIYAEDGGQYICSTAAEFLEKVELLKKGEKIGGVYDSYLNLGKSLEVDAAEHNWNDIDFTPPDIEANLKAQKEIAKKLSDKIKELKQYAADREITLSEAMDRDKEYARLFDESVSLEEEYNEFMKANGLSGDINTRKLARYAKKHGYNSVTIRNVRDVGKYGIPIEVEETDELNVFKVTSNPMSTVYILFDSNQVKSADPVTYDDNGKVIPLSERFKQENDDIRYSERASNTELAKMDDTALYIKNTDKANYIGMIFNGTKTEETRSRRTLDAFIGRDFFVTDGKYVYGSVVLGEPHKYTEAEFHKAENRRKHRVPTGDEYDIKSGGIKWAYPIESYKKFDKPKKLSDSKDYKNSFQARQVMYQDRDTESVSNRSLLANAFEGVAQNDIERNKIQEYKSKIDLINAEERKLTKLNEQIKELSFSKGPKDTKAIRDLQFEAKQTANRINTYDKQLLRLEASKPLQDVITREKKMAYQRAEKKGKEALAEYKEKAAKTQRELLNKYQDARKKGIENRQRSYVRSKIKAFKDRLVRSLDNPTDRQYVPIDLIKAMVEVCGLIDTDTDLYNADGSINKAQEKRNLTKERLQNLKDEYEKLKTHSDPIYAGEFDELVYTYLTELRDKYAGKHLNEMSLDELTEMYEILRAIEETLQDARKLIGWGDAETVYEAGDSIVAEQNDITQSRKNGKRNAAQIARDKSLNNSLAPVRNVERMSGYNQDSALLKLFKRFEEGIRKKNKFVMESYKAFESLTSGKEYEDAIYKDVGGKKYTDIKGRKFGLSKMQMMQAILSWERESANKKLHHIESGGFTFADTDLLRKGRLKEAISAEHSHRVPNAVNLVAEFNEILKDDKWCQDYMAEARKFFNGKAKDAINETSIALKHRIIAKDKNYIPFEVDANFIVREISAANDVQQTINSYGMLQDTKSNAPQALIITGLNNVIDRHIDMVGNVYGLAIEVRNFNKVWNVRSLDAIGNDPTVKEIIETNWGKEGRMHIEQAVQDIQGPRVRERNPLYDKIKSGYIGATFLLNLSVVTKQIGSLYSATSMLKWRGPVRMVGNLMYTMANHKKISAEVDKYTATAWMRRQGLSDAELHTFMTEGKKTLFGRLAGKLPAVFNPGKWITAMDSAVALSLWRYAKIDTAKRTGLKGEELLKATAKFYDDVVENTQSMTDVLHRPEIQKKGDILSESVAMFKTDLYQMAGQLHVTAGRFTANKTKENGMAMGRTVYAVLMSAVWGQLMTTVFALLRYKVNHYRDDEDEELTAESWLKRQGFSFAGDLMGYIMPVFGSEFVGIIETFMYGESEDIVDNIVLDLVNDLYGSMMNVASSLKEGETPKPADMKNITIKAMQVFGIPASNILRTIEAIQLHAKDIANGEFLSFEAGIERSPKHHIHRIVEAMDEGKSNVAIGLFEEALEETAMDKAIAKKKDAYGEEELNEAKSTLQTALGNKYKDGDITEKQAVNILVKCFGMDADDAEQKVGEWNFKTEYGYAWSDRRDAYLEGKISAMEFKSALMDIGGKTAAEADEYISDLDFEAEYGFSYDDRKQAYFDGKVSKETLYNIMVENGTAPAKAREDIQCYDWLKGRADEYPDLTISDAKRFVIKISDKCEDYTLSDYGVSVDTYLEYVERAKYCNGVDADGDGETDSYSKAKQLLNMIDTLPISDEQKEALAYITNAKSTIRKYAPWH